MYNKGKTDILTTNNINMNNTNQKVFLIRHAQSLANMGQRTSDPQHNALTEEGAKQAQKLASSFLEKPELIVYSSYERTYLTAKPLILKYPDVPTEQWNNIHEFTYLNHDHCSNTTPQERLPLVISYWNKLDPNYSDGGNAESFSQMLVRIKTMLKNLKERKENFIVIFTHGQFIETTKIVLGYPEATDEQIMKIFNERKRGKTIENCQITQIS